jgi:hypothetical protein
MDQLPAFLASTLGAALTYELGLLVGFVILLNLRRIIRAALYRLTHHD